MKRLEIYQVTGGFIVKDLSSNAVLGNNTVACCIDTVHAIVRAWADGKEWVPPVAPDAAPAPFLVGDRVVFRDKGRRILENAGPWTVDAVSPYRTVLLNVPADLRDWWVDEGELRHAPEEV